MAEKKATLCEPIALSDSEIYALLEEMGRRLRISHDKAYLIRQAKRALELAGRLSGSNSIFDGDAVPPD